MYFIKIYFILPVYLHLQLVTLNVMEWHIQHPGCQGVVLNEPFWKCLGMDLNAQFSTN